MRATVLWGGTTRGGTAGRPVRRTALGGLATACLLVASGEPAGAAATFAPAQPFPTGSGPASVAIGDLNGDARPDLVVANQSSNTVSVLLAGGAPGAFLPKVDHPTGAQPASVAIGDLNGDGRPDLAVANHGIGANTVSVLLANPGLPGSFLAKTDHTTAAGPTGVAIGDLDEDGRPDLAVACADADAVSVLRGDPGSPGAFLAKTDLPAGNGARSVAIGDLDGDDNLDLAVANGESDKVSVLLATHAVPGTFLPKTDHLAGPEPYSVAIGDLDGDGRPDLAVANPPADTASVLLADPGTPGGFLPKSAQTTGDVPFAVAIGDLDLDGRPDLATANAAANSVSVLSADPADPDGFAAKADRVVGTFPSAVAAGDLDGDAKPDLAVTLAGAAAVTVLRNATPSPATAVPSPAALTFGSVAVGSASPATRVTITNGGEADLTLPAGAVTLAGTDAGRFAVTGDTCSGSAVPGGGTCTIDVTFAPAAAGGASATLRIASDAAASPLQVPLSGTGLSGADGTPTTDTPTAPGAPTAPAGDAAPPAATVREPAKLRVLRARVAGRPGSRSRSRVLELRVAIDPAATGAVTGTFVAGGRTYRLRLPVRGATPAARIPLRRGAPATGTLTLAYPGDARVAPDRLRLRTGPRSPRLTVTAAAVQNGRLTVSGRIARAATGVVRVRYTTLRDGRLSDVGAVARVSRGRWTVTRELPAGTPANGWLTVDYLGDLRRSLRGARLLRALAAPARR